MTGDAGKVRAAKIAADASQARLVATFNVLHARLQPRVLIRDGVDRLRERGIAFAEEAIESAQARPAAAAAAGAGVFLLIFRRRIVRRIRRLFSRRGETDPAAAS